jgi:hypothetical protein
LSQENDEVDKLIKDKIATLKPLADVSDGAKHEITYKGKIVAKFCKRCKRFLKGDKAHFTAEHKRKADTPTPSATTGSTAGSTISTLSSGSPPTANLAAEANVAALDPDPPLTPALMRCEAVDYDTPVLPVNYQACLADDPVDDSSVDSAYNAFMAAPVVEDSPALLVDPPAFSGPWSEVIHSDGEVTLFYGTGADATSYDPAWLAAHGQPSTTAALRACLHYFLVVHQIQWPHCSLEGSQAFPVQKGVGRLHYWGPEPKKCRPRNCARIKIEWL